MPTASTLYLEFDKTGLSPDNLIPYEAHTLLNTATRLIIPKFGAFYTGSLSVFSVYPYTGDYILLTKSVDYLPVEMLHKTTALVTTDRQSHVVIVEEMDRRIADALLYSNTALLTDVDFITTTVSAIKQTLLTVRDQMLKNIKD